VADGQRQLGAVDRVEVELIDPGGAQQPALLGGDGGREQPAQLGIGVRSLEEAGQSVRHRGSQTPGVVISGGRRWCVS
jgi:hypothetical protein